jgi:hypothetical protein
MVPVMNFETKYAMHKQEKKKQREGFVYIEIWRIYFFSLPKSDLEKKPPFGFMRRVGLNKGRR